MCVSGQGQVKDLTPREVYEGLAQGRYLLVDVREMNEIAAEAYPDAVVLPLSSFDPQDIPETRRGAKSYSPVALAAARSRHHWRRRLRAVV